MANPSEKMNRTVSEEKKAEIKQVKAKEKKIVKKIILVLLIVFVIPAACFVIPFILQNKNTKYETVSVVQVEETYPSLNPYNADFDKDLSGHNPEIMYEFPDGNAYSIKVIPDDSKNEAHRFFVKYFDLLKKGDYRNYASLFTESYKHDPKGFEKDFTRPFPPQQLFDIKVTELLRSTDPTVKYRYEGKDCFFGYYLVTYKINENDGMFRRDLYTQQAERPLIFELVTFDKDTDKEVTLIKNMYTESSIPKN